MKPIAESTTVSIPAGACVINGDLRIPADSRCVVIFAHGSGSSRHSPRNRHVADILNGAGIATLLMDLLTAGEEVLDQRTSYLRFDIPLLADRLISGTNWIREHRRLSAMRTGYFGASTGAAAALVAAAQRPDLIAAVVSRGGRPDLAADYLGKVIAPTLLIVGEFDHDVIELNRQAAKVMQAPVEIEIVPAATHLFEERGALEQVAFLARTWFEEKLIRKQMA